MLEIGSVKNSSGFIKKVELSEGRLMGLGHCVYENYVPRAKVIKKIAAYVRASNRSVTDLFGFGVSISGNVSTLAVRSLRMVRRSLFGR